MRKTTNCTLPTRTGTVIPVAALKTAESCGVGEFLDLIPFADFCKKCGLGIIQLLPVNDTGTESSPYSALSAFALHPLYIRLQDLPEAANFKKQIQSLAKKHAGCQRFSYREVRQDKLDLLIKIFAEQADAIMADKKLLAWIESHPWIISYAVFMEKKRENKEASWKSWKNAANPTKEEISAEWKTASKKKNHYFFAWVQMRLDEQFTKAASYVKQTGIILKGDIPIMMNEDSADTWAHPDFFISELRAGSPPDNYNAQGQNWGFPIYNWENLKKEQYSWWKDRLASAAHYYSAYRIDHVLGFFRIWAIPQGEPTAVLGYTQPLAPITTKELTELGFSPERITWLSKSHVPTRAVEEVNNYDYLGTHGLLHTIMDRINTEEMWLFKPAIQHENDIYKTDLPDPVKYRLAEYWKNRPLLEVSKGKFTPIWTYRDTTAWKTLSPEEQATLQNLFNEKQAEMEKLWEKQAKTILKELTSSVDMIPCAEDLGANPESVPRVMQELNILSLRIVRWSREWNKDGQPYIQPETYPKVSVASNSVHDSSTIRGWWLKEHAGSDFLRDFGAADGVSADSYTPETASYILQKIASAKSAFCIHPLQDLLHLSPDYYDPEPDNERVNIPGSVTAFNWTYRIPKTIETLSSDTGLISAIKHITALHTDLP